MLTTLAIANDRSLPALARLIVKASPRGQVWVVSHAPRLVAALQSDARCHRSRLEKELSQTRIASQGLPDEPPRHWPEH